MALDANVIQQQIPKYLEQMSRLAAERYEALINLGMPPEIAGEAAQRIDRAAAPAQPPGPPPAPVPNAALQIRRQIPNPARAAALERLPAAPQGGLAHINPLAPAGDRMMAQQHNDQYNQQLAAYQEAARAAQALPEMIDDPNQALNPELQLPPPQQEVKEREEKHRAEEVGQRIGLKPPNRLAALPEEIKRAAELTNASVGQMAPFLMRSEEQSRQAAQGFPERRADYMNPYTQDVVNKIREDGLRTLNEGILPSIEAQFIRRGAHGGSKHAGLAAKMTRDLERDILERQTQARYTGYGQAAQLFNNDQIRKLQHGQDISRLGGMNQAGNLADISGLTDMGRYKQGHEQHGKENQYYDFLRQKNEPLEMLERQNAFLKGMPAPISQYGYQSFPAPHLGNTASQLGSFGGQLLGMTMRRGGGPIRARTRRMR